MERECILLLSSHLECIPVPVVFLLVSPFVTIVTTIVTSVVVFFFSCILPLVTRLFGV
jgi:hypothetical protein